MWTDIHTLPETNPLRNTTSRMRKFRRSYRSPFFQVANLLKDVPLDSLETIAPVVLAPWERRVRTTVDGTGIPQKETEWAVRIAVSSSARNNTVGIGGVVRLPLPMRDGSRNEAFSVAGLQVGAKSVLRRACGCWVRVEVDSKYQVQEDHPCHQQQSSRDGLGATTPAIRATIPLSGVRCDKCLTQGGKHDLDRLDPSRYQKRAPEHSQSESKGSNAAGRYATNPGSCHAVNGPPYRMGKAGTAHVLTRQSGQAFQESRYSVTREAHSTIIRPPVSKRGRRAGSA
jgi:hypothetical protein